MVTALSRRGLLVGSAVMVLCLGGVVVAATVGANPAPGPEIGPPVLVGVTPTGPGSGAPPSPSGSDDDSGSTDGRPSTGSKEHEGDHGEPEVVGPAPVREVDDDNDRDDLGKMSGG
jgi:hypothetical protein